MSYALRMPISPVYDFRVAADAALSDPHRRETLGRITIKADRNRQAVLPRDFPGHADDLRALAAKIKDRTLARLDVFLDEFITRFEARGGQVHFAGSRDEARQMVLELCREAEAGKQKTEDRRQKTEDRRQKAEDRRQKAEDRENAETPKRQNAEMGQRSEVGSQKSEAGISSLVTRHSLLPHLAIGNDLDSSSSPLRIVKVKSMVSEELHLLHVLEEAGMDVCETDLAEYVIQVGHRRPAHIVTAIMDMNRHEVSKLFHEKLHQPESDDPRQLTLQARQLLRERFRQADVGISGGNFLVAETGTLIICTNEGNGRMCTTVPDTHLAIVGVEKVVPTWSEAAVLLKLLTRSASAHDLTVYTSCIHGPRQPGELDGPRQVHLVLLDAGRTGILESEAYHQALRCIRCGACLNACPVFRQIGGQPYGGTYSGPIGKVITPLLNGEQTYCDLPNASTLCGACYEACPVQINLPRMLVELRRDQNRRKETPLAFRALLKLWSVALQSRAKYEVAQKTFGWFFGSQGRDWIRLLPFGNGWTKTRDFPAPAEKPFRQLWKEKNP